MNNLTQGTNCWKAIFAVVLVTGLALLSSCSNSAAATIIFTKWGTTNGAPPVLMNMEGVVSGDAGAGKYVGEVLEYKPTPTGANITALYHINGKMHSFTARMSVTEDDKTGTAMLKGVVTDGWMKDAKVTGSYTVITPSGIINAQNGAGGDVAFQGTLHVEP